MLNRKKICTYLLLAVFFYCNKVHAIDFNGTKWISIDQSSVKSNLWVCFRKSFDLNTVQSSSTLYLAVDSKYWLWINGQMVIFEGELKRGPNPEDTYYDKVAIGRYLKKGKNTISILMWYWGKSGFSHLSSGKPGLLAKIQLKNQTIASDESWKVKIHPAYGASGPPYPNPRLSEFNIHFDARKDINGWEKKNYDDSSWPFAQVLGNYPCKPWNKLVERPIPNWYNSGILKYDSVSYHPTDSNVTIRAKLPRNLSITPYFKIRSGEGKLIDLRTDNYKGGSEYNVRAEYITKNGVQEFEAFNYVNGHSVIYTLPKGIEVIALGYRETRYNTKHIGNFKCSDGFYNRLRTKALNTMNLNMRDAIQDADRERSQWWGDAVIVSGEILYSCDNDGTKIITKAIKNLVDWQEPGGALHSPIPGIHKKELPAQMLAAIGKFGFWNYYVHTGDYQTIHYVYPAVKKYLSLWTLGDSGLLNHRSGNWDWYDWGNNIDITVMENAWYCLALESASNMAKLLGHPDDASTFLGQREKIKKAVNAYLWDGTEYRTPSYNGNTDDRANGLAVLAGFADKEKWQLIRRFLNTYANAGPYMEKYILEAFFQQGDAASALNRMKRRYEEMVDSKLTTLWEDWKIGGSGGGSINHGWAAGPLTLLSQYVAGIEPVDPGWTSFIVKPQLADLKWVHCTVPAGNKTISVDIKKTNKSLEMNVSNTLGCTYILAIPNAAKAKKITINNKTFDKATFMKLNSPKLSFLRLDNDYFYITTSKKNIKIVAF
ncbi:MAG: alpha-L-rhamnosidase-related protein [Flavisolibacter sp.]